MHRGQGALVSTDEVCRRHGPALTSLLSPERTVCHYSNPFRYDAHILLYMKYLNVKILSGRVKDESKIVSGECGRSPDAAGQGGPLDGSRAKQQCKRSH